MQSGSPAARAAADVVLIGDAFAVLPRAVVAGQRIVEGMRLVTCLLFTRTVYALLVVLGAAALSLEFPMTPRTNSVLALMTVGIPTLVLAAWAPAGRSRAGLVSSAIRFSVPAGIAVAALALPVYATYAGGAGGIAAARTALTAVSVWCGILLIPFLIPPGRGRDVRPTLLAVTMSAAFGLVLAVPALRELFELAPLPLADLAALAVLALLWAVVLFRLRAMRVVARVIRTLRLAQAR
jgi:cation-transporting ATPase E